MRWLVDLVDLADIETHLASLAHGHADQGALAATLTFLLATQGASIKGASSLLRFHHYRQ